MNGVTVMHDPMRPLHWHALDHKVGDERIYTADRPSALASWVRWRGVDGVEVRECDDARCFGRTGQGEGTR